MVWDLESSIIPRNLHVHTAIQSETPCLYSNPFSTASCASCSGHLPKGQGPTRYLVRRKEDKTAVHENNIKQLYHIVNRILGLWLWYCFRRFACYLDVYPVHRYHCTISLRLAEELGEEKEAEFEFVRACKLMPKENFYLLVAICWYMFGCGTLVVLNNTTWVLADYILTFHIMFDAKVCSEV